MYYFFKGNLPPIVISDDSVSAGAVSIMEERNGSTDSLEECGGFGKCNLDSGKCNCFGKGSSSDGVGLIQLSITNY